MTALLIFLIILGIYCACDAAKRGKAELKRISENNTNIPLQTRLYKKYFRQVINDINRRNPHPGEYYKCLTDIHNSYGLKYYPHITDSKKRYSLIKADEKKISRYESNRLWNPTQSLIEFSLKENQGIDCPLNVHEKKWGAWYINLRNYDHSMYESWSEDLVPLLEDYEKMYLVTRDEYSGRPEHDYKREKELYGESFNYPYPRDWGSRDHWGIGKYLIIAGAKKDNIELDSPAFMILFNKRLYVEFKIIVDELTHKEMESLGYVWTQQWEESPNKKI